MTTKKRESLLVASGVFILTAGCIETLRWFGYLGTVTPITKIIFAALLAATAYSLLYYIRAGK